MRWSRFFVKYLKHLREKPERERERDKRAVYLDEKSTEECASWKTFGKCSNIFSCVAFWKRKNFQKWISEVNIHQSKQVLKSKHKKSCFQNEEGFLLLEVNIEFSHYFFKKRILFNFEGINFNCMIIARPLGVDLYYKLRQTAI